MEVLFEYTAAEYRCIIYAEKSKLCREIEHHLNRAGVADPEVSILSYTLSGPQRRHDGRTQFFLQQWDGDWECYVNVDSLEEVVDGDRLTAVARRSEKQADCSLDDPADHEVSSA